MEKYRTQIKEGGRLIIPTILRKKLHLDIGENVFLRIEEGELRVSSLLQAVKKAQDVVTKHNLSKESLVEALKKLRQKDFINE